MNNSPNTTPWDPSPVPSQSEMKSSQKDVLSSLMLMASLVALVYSFIGGAKLVYDVLSTGVANSINTLPAKAVVLGVAYAVGWVTAVIAERVFKNKFVPFFIILFMWGCLFALCFLYILVLMKLYNQGYSPVQFWAYLTMLVAALAAMVGLHLVFEDHDLRPFSYLLLFISLGQLGLMVYRYVFTPADQTFLWRDLLVFVVMGGSGSLMLAHIGLLTPLRNQITGYIKMNRWAIWKDN